MSGLSILMTTGYSIAVDTKGLYMSEYTFTKNLKIFTPPLKVKIYDFWGLLGGKNF